MIRGLNAVSCPTKSRSSHCSFLQRTLWLAALVITLFLLGIFAVLPALQRDERSILPRNLNPETFMITRQSSGINFSDWITLFTLCLAPLAAHLIAGVPDPGM
jgi:hypothetical protein